MIIRSLREYWPSRKMEWLGAGLLVSWGLYVLLHPEIFTNPATAVVLSGLVFISERFTDHPALFWGGLGFGIGLARAVALFVNGAYTRTPLIRVITSFLSIFIVTQIVVGLWQSGVSNPDLVVYPWIIVADILSAYRASVDVVHAETLRRQKKEAELVSNVHPPGSLAT